ncbi:MAG: ABC transporter substrate-binding protein [Methanoregulaceae archaeon]|nr:ABC transporter substrate-binding protein [Methanoregulaceae archaeon]
MRLASLALTGLAVLSLMVGCAKPDSGVGGQPAPKVYKSVVSLSPSSSEIAGIVFLREFRGRSESCDQPGHVKEAPVVMKGLKPDYEKIVAIKPDCVVYDPDLFQQSDIDKFKELGIDTFPLGKGDTVDEFIDMIYEFSKFTQAETLGSEYVDKIVRERSTALASAPTPPVSVAMLMSSNGAEHMISGTESFIADVIRSGGGKPVGPSGRLFMTMNAESFMAMDPDIVIVAGAPDGFLNDPRFKNMSAVKRKTVYGTNPSVALRKGAFVERFIKRVSELVQNFKR